MGCALVLPRHPQAYIPMFIDVHTDIIANPFTTKATSAANGPKIEGRRALIT